MQIQLLEAIGRCADLRLVQPMKGTFEMTNSFKTASLALAAIVTAGAIATPVFAANDGSLKFDSTYLIQQLRYDGVNAIAADQVSGDTFRATVVSGGHQSFAFYNIDSLQQIK